MSNSPTAPGLWHRLLGVLRCPLCGGALAPPHGVPASFNTLRGVKSLGCAEGHSFDVARQGYLSLLTGNTNAANADSADMVTARTFFLKAGHYEPLAHALAAIVAELCPPDGAVMDAGAGTGHYLATVLDALPEAVGLGLDVSKFALRRAAGAHPRAGAATWDIWKPLPVVSGAADVVINVFAPRNGPEFQRVLRPDGALVVVTPTARHLGELPASLGMLSVDAAKEDRLHRTLSDHFRQERTDVVEREVTMTDQDVRNLILMGPSAHHLSLEDVHRSVASLDTPLAVTVSFLVSVYRPL
ncbi:putative RNA methyltransferase [Streptomyces sp. NPDC051217]|uniref:putative RNA methyltransferase n=1 Tax=Streptomyces sp. NPDC051217 TaxID=3365644 RepID=UPI0037B3CF68